MSSTRSCNKFCLSLDSAFSDTSSNTIHLNRWSEVVPPKTALTFAALWDPEEGMVTFSGAALLEPESLSSVSPHPDVFEGDGNSLLTIDHDSDRQTTTSETAATLTTFQDAFKAFIYRTPWNSREHLNTKAGQGTPRCLQTRASSTFDGLDVYSHDIQIKPNRPLQLSYIDLMDIESSFRTPSAYGRLRLRSDLTLDAYGAESKENDVRRPPCLRSRFSATTASDRVDATTNTLQSARSAETIVADWGKDASSPVDSCQSFPHRRRLLRKRRRPAESQAFSSTPRKMTSQSSMSPAGSPPSPVTMSPSSTVVGDELRGRFPRPAGELSSPVPTPKDAHPKIRFSLLRKRRSRQTSPESEGWVVIEVTPVIRQRIMADLAYD